MPRYAYVEKSFKERSLALIMLANEIISEYSRAGLGLTLRQLYYQFVARDLIPNTDREYKRLGKIISDARLAGYIDWFAIEDRTRNLRGNTRWKDPAQIVDACVGSFQIDRWENQLYRVEVWIEKDALIGVLEMPCIELDVPYFSCRGYTSQSELWRAGQRFKRHFGDGQIPVVLHLGDHDPSGIDMTRDIQDRLELFIGAPLDVKRLALTKRQINKYNPPPNPAKLTDSRARGYIRKHGYDSWELDALDPRTIQKLVSDSIKRYRDPELWKEAKAKEAAYIADLKKMRDDYKKFAS